MYIYIHIHICNKTPYALSVDGIVFVSIWNLITNSIYNDMYHSTHNIVSSCVLVITCMHLTIIINSVVSKLPCLTQCYAILNGVSGVIQNWLSVLHCRCQQRSDTMIMSKLAVMV